MGALSARRLHADPPAGHGAPSLLIKPALLRAKKNIDKTNKHEMGAKLERQAGALEEEIKLPIPPELLADLRNPLSNARKSFNRFISAGNGGTDITSPLATTFYTVSKYETQEGKLQNELLTMLKASRDVFWSTFRILIKEKSRGEYTLQRAGVVEEGTSIFAFKDVVDEDPRLLIIVPILRVGGNGSHAQLLVIDKARRNAIFIDPHGSTRGESKVIEEWMNTRRYKLYVNPVQFQKRKYGGICATATLMLSMFLAVNYKRGFDALILLRALDDLHADVGENLPLYFVYFLRLTIDRLGIRIDFPVVPNQQYIRPELRGSLSRTHRPYDGSAAAASDTYAGVTEVAPGNVNAADDRGVTPLMRASTHGQLKAVQELLAAGANVNAANVDGGTALFYASSNVPALHLAGDRLLLVQALLAAGASVNAATRDGWTALIMASSNGHFPVVERLIAAGANVNAANVDGYTALMSASKHGHLHVVERLIAAGANVNAANVDGWTALMSASKNGHLHVVERLIAAGANVKAATVDGWTALMSASKNGHLHVVERLIAAGANVKAATVDGETALTGAERRGNLSVVHALLAAGADGIEALRAAASAGNQEYFGIKGGGWMEDESAGRADGWLRVARAAAGLHWRAARPASAPGAAAAAAAPFFLR